MKRIINYIIITITVFFISCEQSEDKGLINNNNNNKSEIEYANAIKAIKLFKDGESGKTKSSSDEVKLKLNSSSVITFNRENLTKSTLQENADSVKLFIFDMIAGENDGFAIACANSKFGHVLAYVENGNVADTIFNYGLKQTLSVLPFISEELARNAYPYDDYYFGDGEFLGSYPLLKTKWTQGQPYNWGTPSSTCSSGYYLAGCGAIATAQVIAYYRKYNTKYDFTALTSQPDIKLSSSSYLKSQVSSFIASVGKGILSNYGCNATGSYTYLACSFLRDMGYSINQLSMYNWFELEKTLISKNLVMCAGYDGERKVGHIWIIDGYRQYITYSSPSYVHCNWGWGGNSDGWYYNVEELFVNPINRPDTHYKYYVDYVYVNG